ncbi:hypothetical protein SAMN05660653_00187 [Desulfonatronum thiosulfatophilum]|uniref:Uncharacterized protein n=1 Tax=Desulfonatronum thiosulfatophilum TaxID=617002 RepID=A0A1G6A6J3_9BACT|nr:hypothetical protein [Desulfonatronum thiosulfatophilum]SDB04024.1 hypothetical protein SAMN05660653_00187 [Desulfonatronum thiosulfatophilum]
MRELVADRNIIEIRDTIGGCVHEIYFRVPTTKERARYNAGRFYRDGKKIVDRTFVQNIEYGLAIMVGFRKGTFGIDGKAFSADKSDPDYREDWKELLRKAAPEIAAAVGGTVLGGVEMVRLPSAEDLEDLELTVEEYEPVGESSSGTDQPVPSENELIVKSTTENG